MQQNFKNFTKFFQKSNSSIYQLQGCVLDCNIEQVRGNKVIVDTGMRSPFVCSQDELNEPSVVVKIAALPAETESGVWNSQNMKSTNKHKYTTFDSQRPKLAPVANKILKTKCSEVFNSFSRALCRNRVESTLATVFPTKIRLCRTAESASQPNKVHANGSFLASNPCQNSTKYASFVCKRMSSFVSSFRTFGAFAPLYSYENSLITKRCHLRACVIGIEEKRSVDSKEFGFAPPKSIEKLSRRKLIWAELTKLWRTSSQNRLKGFILNSVNGGYAVAIAGYIAFLPKSLCLNKKVFIGQWRQFAIISMNPKIANIVVKEIKTNYPSLGKNKYKVKINRREAKNRQNNRAM
jgi:hypothetical protein